MTKKITFLVIGLLVSLMTLQAQTYFETQNIVIETEASEASAVFTTDIDGDGDKDIIFASYDVGKIAWFENLDGNGNFGRHKIITTNAKNVVSIFATDIDNDGDVDVISATTWNNSISWYENIDGNGNFGNQQVVSTDGDNAQYVYATDIDGDGDVDILAAFRYAKKIVWYENTNGSGSFGNQQIITTDVDWAKSIYATDIDGDGDQDIISASRSDNKIAWYENTDGSGNFGSQQIISTDVSNPRSAIAIDIDGDGDQDIISSSEFDDKIAWYENTDGNGSFGSQQIISTDADNPTSIFAIDIDGDNDYDILSSSNNDGKIAWYENTDGNGLFSEQKIITTDADGAWSVFATDINGNGYIDVISASWDDNKIAWYENTDGNGVFGEQQTLTTDIGEPQSISLSDINGDTHIDIVSASLPNGIKWYENINGTGVFNNQNIISQNGADAIFTADLNGDGYIDLVSINQNKVTWYQNIDGNGNFGDEQIISASVSGGKSIFAIDLDNDGDIDVLSASGYDDKIAWYENTDGAGNFGSQQIITMNTDYACSVFSADIDGDGDNDVLSASSNDDRIAWYENTDGAGNFGSQQNITTSADYAMLVYAKDIDNDGDIDVFSTSGYDDKITLYKNTDGAGNFGSPQIIITNSSNKAIFAADLNRNDNIDVITSFDSGIAWFENIDGNGNFENEQIITQNARGTLSLQAIDIDGDEDIDIVSASFIDKKIAWYENITLIILNQPSDNEICPNSNTNFEISANDVNTYQWQVDEGSGFYDIVENTVYSGINTNNLQITNATVDMSNYQYQCVISNTAGSQNSNVVTLTIGDFENPEITSTHNVQQVDANINCEASLLDYTGDLTATDNCDNDLDITQSPTAGSTISGTTNEITLTVTDDAGNYADISFNVEVVDNTNPTITCVGNQTKQLLEGETVYTVSGTEFDPTESSDNCDFTVTNDFNSSATLENADFPIGSTIVVWTITDNASNSANCSFDVQVNAFVNIETLQKNGISIYPNPTNGIINIKFADINVQKLTISDITGKMIIEKVNIQQNQMIDFSKFESGIYIIKIQTDNEIFTTKIVKE